MVRSQRVALAHSDQEPRNGRSLDAGTTGFLAGSHRLLHIHHNVPGVLSRINSVFSQKRINISGQYLMTNARIGYVVIDVEAESSRIAKKALADIEGTIRTRVLF